MVTRAKIGMSTSAAISAAPTKKLTASDAPGRGRARARRAAPAGARLRRLRHTKPAAASAEASRTRGRRGRSTCTSGSAVAKARITPPSEQASRPAPGRSAWPATSRQRRRSTSGWAAVQAAGDERAEQDVAARAPAGSASATRRRRAGTARPSVTPLVSHSRLQQHQAERGETEPGQRRADEVGPGRRRPVWTGAAPGGRTQRRGQHQADGEVEPEDRVPAGERRAPRRRTAGRGRCRAPAPRPTTPSGTPRRAGG